MKSTILLVLFALVFSACDSGTDGPPSNDDITPEKFNPKPSMDSRYDVYVVDTAGVYYDKPILSTRTEVQETITDTGLTFAGKERVSQHLGNSDTLYFTQDANGDLYQYNYGFDFLNKFEYLRDAAGGDIDMKWVLIMKFGKKEGATWVAKADSLFLPSFNSWVQLRDTAVMKADTTIQVGTASVRCRQAQHRITASSSLGTGTIVTNIYISAEHGKVVWDFIRSGKITGLINAKVQGVWKIMTFHEGIQ